MLNRVKLLVFSPCACGYLCGCLMVDLAWFFYPSAMHPTSGIRAIWSQHLLPTPCFSCKTMLWFFACLWSWFCRGWWECSCRSAASVQILSSNGLEWKQAYKWLGVFSSFFDSFIQVEPKSNYTQMGSFQGFWVIENEDILWRASLTSKSSRALSASRIYIHCLRIVMLHL